MTASARILHAIYPQHSANFTELSYEPKILVKRGDQVRRCRVIAKSGEVAPPRLNFEIRNGPAAVDPIQYRRVARQHGPFLKRLTARNAWRHIVKAIKSRFETRAAGPNEAKSTVPYTQLDPATMW
jgi:hypothetical protein